MEYKSFFKKSLKNLANFFETFGMFLNVFVIPAYFKKDLE